MKKIISHLNKSTFLALAFFGIMTLVGISTAHAQNDTLNPLFSTTGPNVLGEGRIQWNSSLDFYHSSLTFNENDYSISSSYGATTGLRFGIGNRAELTFDVSGNYSFVESSLIDGLHTNTNGARASVGAKLLLSDGRRWLPQVAFFTHVGVNNEQYAFNRSVRVNKLQPQIGFMFRNQLGRRWAIDYSLGYAWSASSEPGIDFANQIEYSLFARWLALDRLSFGVGVSNVNSARRMIGGFEVRYQPSDNIQLSLQSGSILGLGDGVSDSQAHALLGLHWTLR